MTPWPVSSERLPEEKMQHAAALEASGRELTPIELEPEIDADGADRRVVGDAKARGRAKLPKVDVRGALEDVARVDEADGADAAEQRHAHFAVQHDQAVAAGRKPGRADRRIRPQP